MNATQNGALIHLENLTKVFQTDEVETHALAGVHLDIQKGDYIAISGPSGCGKSTLLSILGLLDSPSGGAYRLNGQPVESLKARQRARIRNREIGFVFQSFNLIGDLTVYENVELPLTYRGMGRAERRSRVAEALERVGMAHRSKHYPASSPAASSSAWPWRARSSASRRSCWPTSPPATSTRRTARRSWNCSRDLHRERRHDLHGHARPALRAPRRSHDPPLRRPHRGRGRARGRGRLCRVGAGSKPAPT